MSNGDTVAYHYAFRGSKVAFWASRSFCEEESAEYWALYNELKPARLEMMGFLEERRNSPLSPRSQRAKRAVEMLRASKRRAAQRGWAHTITVADILAIAIRQQGLCAISGLPLDWQSGLSNTIKNPYGASLDRIDSSKGYTPKNVRPVLVMVNFGMSNWGQATFERICRAVA